MIDRWAGYLFLAVLAPSAAWAENPSSPESESAASNDNPVANSSDSEKAEGSEAEALGETSSAPLDRLPIQTPVPAAPSGARTPIRERVPQIQAAGPSSKPAESKSDSPASSEEPKFESKPNRATVEIDDSRFRFSWDGKIRTEFSTFYPRRVFFGVRTPSDERTRQNPSVGRNDGFAVGSARLNLRGTFQKHLYVRVSFDGALASYEDDLDTTGRLDSGLRDAYARYTWETASISVGRFKPPLDVEQLTPTEDQYFVHRALESRGVQRHEGQSGDAPGFAPGRQLGVMVTDPQIAARGSWILGYSAALTNGNAEDARRNDNDLPAVYGRLTSGWNFRDRVRRTDEEGPATHGITDGFLVGLSAAWNQQTRGAPPNRLDDRILTLGVDASLHLSWLAVRGQLLVARTDHLFFERSVGETAWGSHIQAAFPIAESGFAPGYRFAWYNPSSVVPNDRIMHHTLALRYLASDWPVVSVVEYTHSVEQTGRTLRNDRIEAAVQVTFE